MLSQLQATGWFIYCHWPPCCYDVVFVAGSMLQATAPLPLFKHTILIKAISRRT
jgi:hypothetical protein